MKPVATGCIRRDGAPGSSEDAAALQAAASSELPIELVSPYRYRSALGPVDAAKADGASPPSFAAIGRALRLIGNASDIVLVEDTYGLAAKLDASHDFAELARAHQLQLILVVGHRPGFAAAAQRALEFAAAREVPVSGVILNALDRGGNEQIAVNAEMLASAIAARVLGTVRFQEPLSLAIVDCLLTADRRP